MVNTSTPQNGRQLREALFESRADDTVNLRTDALAHFEQLCREGKVGLDPTGTRHSPSSRAPVTYRLRELAEAIMGPDWSKRYESLSLAESLQLMEAPAFVSSAVFPQITSQLIFSEIRRQFDMEANVFTPLVPVIPSDIKGTEVVPSITSIDPDDAGTVNEGEPYPRVGVTEEYFTIPAKTKRGMVIELTREAVRFDRTNMLVDQARGVGAVLGASRENAIIDALIGQTNNYSRNGTASNTYLTAGAYINNQSSTPLTDWRDVDNALQLFAAILDPNTSEPLAGAMRPRHLIVNPFKLMTAQYLLSATEARANSNDAAGTATDETVGGNPLAGLGLQPLSSIRLYRRILAGPESVAATAREGWFLGNLDELLAWYEAWPLEVVQQGRDSDAGFDRDIDMKFKASYYGVAAVREPRKMLRLENAAW